MCIRDSCKGQRRHTRHAILRKMLGPGVGSHVIKRGVAVPIFCSQSVPAYGQLLVEQSARCSAWGAARTRPVFILLCKREGHFLCGAGMVASTGAL